MSNKIRNIAIFLFCITTFFILFSVLFSSNITSLSASSLTYLFGRISGLFGLLLLGLLIFSGDTSRFFDRFIGMDKIIKFQRKFSIITSVFVLMHPILFIISDSNFINYIIPKLSLQPVYFGTLALYLFIIVGICSKFYKRISYKAWQYIHILTYILFFSGFYHAIKLGTATSTPQIKLIFYIILSLVSIGILYRTYYKIKNKPKALKVHKIKWENEKVFTIYLEKDNFNFKSGQFAFLRLENKRLFARHPFTISSSPEEKLLSFSVKIEGRFTKELSKLKKNSKVLVEGPFGIFTINNSKKKLFLFAGGIGITPFVSILKNLQNEKSKNEIELFYSSKEATPVFKKEIDKIKNLKLEKNYFITSGKNKERISKEIIEKKIKNKENSLFYICGPQEFKIFIKESLISIGIPKKYIFSESFFW